MLFTEPIKNVEFVCHEVISLNVGKWGGITDNSKFI